MITSPRTELDLLFKLWIEVTFFFVLFLIEVEGGYVVGKKNWNRKLKKKCKFHLCPLPALEIIKRK